MISTCLRCKKRRIKCDLQLPGCKNCTASETECVIWDECLNAKVSREEIHTRLQRVILLQEQLEKTQHSPQEEETDEVINQGLIGKAGPQYLVPSLKNQTIEDLLPFRWETVKKGYWYGEDRGPDAIFFGSSSPISVAVWASSLLGVRIEPPKYVKEEVEEFRLPKTLITQLMMRKLLKHYEEKIYPEYPLIAPSFFNMDVKLKNLPPRQQIFTLLALVAASTHLSRSEKDYRVISATLRNWLNDEVGAYLEEYTDDTFLVFMFLILMEELDPRSQNLYVLLSMACRYAVIRGFYRDTTDDVEERTSRRNLFLVLYKMESEIAGFLGRPMLLPCESIMFEDADQKTATTLRLTKSRMDIYRMIFNGPDDSCVFSQQLVEELLSLPILAAASTHWFLASLPFAIHRCHECENLHLPKSEFRERLVKSFLIKLDDLYRLYKEDQIISLWIHTLYCFSLSLAMMVYYKMGYLSNYWTSADFEKSFHKIIEMMGYCRLGWAPAALYLEIILEVYNKSQALG
ncbi:unnamed protein product [Kuraishia capsulata CBS 1993]|uniref:Zn(2)-C6 fungal-type domain-containing protein n=1 Tax=Kuraishia capsulata CBS 1993 TaxID=1382522 RepID=W6MNH5_9ASCO|nr:uncharacterized protein KUCA_T00002560001 [Kuraishia capsulata CBS 1993]CDK26587.1 unnamed protein product [Kuraishia capsulata CBS 1993]